MITGKPKPSMHGSVSDRNNAPPTDKSDSRANLTIAIQPEKVAKWLLIIVFAIVVLGAIANIMIYNIAPSTDHPIAKFMKRFDLGHEPSLPNWYSSVALLVTSILFTIPSAMPGGVMRVQFAPPSLVIYNNPSSVPAYSTPS